MEKTNKFLQTAFLGLIVVLLIILLFQFNYWASDLKMTLRKSIVYQNEVHVKQKWKNYLKQRPSCKVPNKSKKQKI